MTTITSEVVPSNPSYTPPSYFFPMGLGTYLLATVKGTQRRSSIEKLIEEGSVLDVEDWLAHSSLDDRTRELIGRFHPDFMGGEYLPDLKLGEIEIARIELASTTADVISIRAIKRKSRIYYSVQDEYSTKFKFKPRWSNKPITLSQVINLIETASNDEWGSRALSPLFLLEYNYLRYGADLDTSRSFVRITSAFYPELESYYEQVIEEWYQIWSNKHLIDNSEDQVEEEMSNSDEDESDESKCPICSDEYCSKHLVISFADGQLQGGALESEWESITHALKIRLVGAWLEDKKRVDGPSNLTNLLTWFSGFNRKKIIKKVTGKSDCDDPVNWSEEVYDELELDGNFNDEIQEVMLEVLNTVDETSTTSHSYESGPCVFSGDEIYASNPDAVMRRFQMVLGLS